MSREELTERVSTLEIVLGEFIVQSNKTLNRMEQDTRELKADLQIFREESALSRQKADEQMQKSEQKMQKFVEESVLSRQKADQWMQRSEKESIAFKKEMFKKWGDLANKMGSFAEDIAAPNMRRIALEEFGCPQIDLYTVRSEKRNPTDPTVVAEFDAVVVAGQYVFVNETKTGGQRTQYVDEFQHKLDSFFVYFPELAGKTLIGVYTGMHLPENIVNYLTKKGIYAMAMGDETMELLNFDGIQKKARH